MLPANEKLMECVSLQGGRAAALSLIPKTEASSWAVCGRSSREAVENRNTDPATCMVQGKGPGGLGQNASPTTC